MDSCVESSGHQSSSDVPPSLHQTILEKSAPENLLSRTRDEEQKQKDKNPIGTRSQRINPSDLGFCPGKDGRGNFVSQEKDEVKDECRQESPSEGAEVKG